MKTLTFFFDQICLNKRSPILLLLYCGLSTAVWFESLVQMFRRNTLLLSSGSRVPWIGT